MNSPHLAPAFVFSRAGYDVWFGNNRGNFFSMEHETLKADEREFWDFDFEDMGLYDLPAEIDFILAHTGKTQIDAYVAHSEGTTQMLIGASMKPDYFKSKIGLFVAFAPVARLDHTTSKIMKSLGTISPGFFTSLVELFGLYNFQGRGRSSETLGELCHYLPTLCQAFASGFGDFQ